jgi:hypothetical protein
MYVEYVKKEYEDMLDVQDTFHDSEVVELKAKLAKAAYDQAQGQEQLASMRSQMSRTIAALKESLESVRGQQLWGGVGGAWPWEVTCATIARCKGGVPWGGGGWH